MKSSLCGSVEKQGRWPTEANDFDVLPKDAIRVAGSQSFHGCFFRRKSSCECRHGVPSFETISNFSLCEDPLKKSIAETFNGRIDAWDIRSVKSYGEKRVARRCFIDHDAVPSWVTDRYDGNR